MRLAIVIVTYHAGPELRDTLDALGAQRRPDDEVVVVDNASGDGTVALARAHAAVTRVVETGGNLGFATGCNRGIAAASPDVDAYVFLNPDCVVEPGCLDALRRPPEGWAAWMGMVLLEDGARVNSWGNEIHFLGLGWSGGVERVLADAPTEPREVGFLSGACLAIRREALERVGGFPDAFFMYCEDADLSLRLRLAGLPFGVLPSARVRHAYAFAKGGAKWRLLERNRWLCVLRTYPTPVLRAALPAMLALEPAMLAVAFAGGWGPQKLRAIAGVVGALPRTLRERRAVQAAAPAADAGAFAAALRTQLDSPYFGAVGRSGVVNGVLSVYWAVARRVARVPTPRATAASSTESSRAPSVAKS